MKMDSLNVFMPEMTPALMTARHDLCKENATITDKIEDASCILLPIPYSVTGELWNALPEGKPIFGGNLPCDHRHITYDLLKDPHYLSANAEITARCAFTMAAQSLPLVSSDWEAVVIGWGRIGSSLAGILHQNGASVTVCSGTPKSREICLAMGFSAISPESLSAALPRFRIIFNTAPKPILNSYKNARRDALMIDLASVPGIPDRRTVSARGLPGKMAPESSGRLIAKTVLRVFHNKEWTL